MADPIGVASDADLLSRFAAVVGAGGLISGPEAAPYYTDVFRAGSTPLAILRPDSVPDLQMVVRIAAAAGLAIFPRGGGASYTDGFLPNTQHSIVIDTGRLNQILQINETDATVTVEAGVTWASLKAALDPLGLRTPFFGPFSGLAASVGGAMAQHSVTHGSGAHGISAQSAVAMDVVLATGELLRTNAGQAGAAPFTRYYGPDLTGLFTGDCGALGIKARITLPLLRRKPDFDGLSVAFADFAGLAAAIRALALERLDDEHFAMDAALSQGQIARQDARSMLAAARSVFRSSSNPFTALRRLARMAVAGTERLANSAYTLHVIIDGANRGEVRAKCRRLRELFSGGQEIPNTVPVLVRGMPFAPLFNTLGPAGERWVPVHGILPHSRVAAFHAALQALYESLAVDIGRLGVWTGGMFTAVGSTGLLYEVALYWPGAQTAYHRAAIPPAYLATLPRYKDDPEVTNFVDRLKRKIVDLFEEFSAAHFQIGRMYPYESALQQPALALLNSVKQQLDPQGLMNPGVLGLELQCISSPPDTLMASPVT